MRRAFQVVLLGAVGLSVVAAGLVSWKFRPTFRAWAASRVKLVDDFNDGADPNLIGGESFTEASSGAQVTKSLLRIHTPEPGELACEISYDLPTGGGGSWGTGLNDLDISAARAVQFWLRIEREAPRELRLELVDGFGGRVTHTLPRLTVSEQWQRITVPASALKGVDFNRLARIILRVSAPGGPLKGSFLIDDMAFVGPPSLFFRSLQDNLYAFPRRTVTNARPLLGLPAREMLRAIAEDTWGYFRDLVDSRHALPLNYIQTAPERRIGDYASTTDVALYLLSVVGALDFDFIDYPSALQRIRDTLAQLEQLPKWNGCFYNYYSTTNLQVTRRYISSVDNGWLAAALVVIRQAFPELAPPATRLLNGIDFSVFYDPQNGQMRLGYEEEEGRLAPYHYGLLATEARIISAVAIGKGDVPDEHWFKVYRTLPKEWTWQQQTPKGQYKSYDGHDVFQGYYTYDDGTQQVPFVPSWGGSLFEFLMPTLVMDEQQLAPHGLGLNNQRAVDIHIRYALQNRRYPVWGLSPCATPNERHGGGYSEYGVAGLGTKGYKDEAIVTPHVSFLALALAPKAAEENLREFIRRYELYGPYGFYDSVDVQTGEVAHRYLALDQGMSFIALDNYLNDGAIQKRFSADPIMRRVKGLLRVERFFDHNAVAQANE